MRRIGRPSGDTALAVLALFIALGGTGYAAATIGSSQIKNNSVRGKDVRNSNLTGTRREAQLPHRVGRRRVQAGQGANAPHAPTRRATRRWRTRSRAPAPARTSPRARSPPPAWSSSPRSAPRRPTRRRGSLLAKGPFKVTGQCYDTGGNPTARLELSSSEAGSVLDNHQVQSLDQTIPANAAFDGTRPPSHGAGAQRCHPGRAGGLCGERPRQPLRVRAQRGHAPVRPSRAISAVAIFVALGGTGYAAATVGSAQIKNNSVRGKDVRNSNLTGQRRRSATPSPAPTSPSRGSARSAARSGRTARGAAERGGRPGRRGLGGPAVDGQGHDQRPREAAGGGHLAGDLPGTRAAAPGALHDRREVLRDRRATRAWLTVGTQL